MRKIFFFAVLWCLVAFLEMSASLFFGFYVLGALVACMIMMGWDFTSPWLGALFSLIGGYGVMIVSALIDTGGQISPAYALHLLIYAVVVVFCTYEISRKEKVPYH